jgi:hypothetical protein
LPAVHVRPEAKRFADLPLEQLAADPMLIVAGIVEAYSFQDL